MGAVTPNAFECKHGAVTPKDVLDALPESQEAVARHKCAACAYRAGQQSVVEWLEGDGVRPPGILELLEAVEADQ